MQISDIDFSIHVEAALEEHYYTKRRQNSDGVCFNTHADVCWGLGKWQLYHVTPDVSRLVPGRCQETDKANTDGTKGYIKKKRTVIYQITFKSIRQVWGEIQIEMKIIYHSYGKIHIKRQYSLQSHDK